MRIKRLIPLFLVPTIGLASPNLEVLSPVARALIGKYADRHGPNCLNAVMIAKGEESALRHVTPYEYEEWLQKKLQCSVIPRGEIAAGDIISIYEYSASDSEVLHGAISLGDGYIFEKEGMDQEFPYRISALSRMLKNYEEGGPLGRSLKLKSRVFCEKKYARASHEGECFFVEVKRCRPKH